METEQEFVAKEDALRLDGWTQTPALRWVDPMTLDNLSTQAAFAVHAKRNQKPMKDTHYLTLLNMARTVAQKAHYGQFRRDGVTPYLEHPKAVAARAKNDPEAEILGWLHDVGESDASVVFTAQQLLDLGFPVNIVAAWDLLTRKPGQSYEEHIVNITRDALATRAKINDNLTNLSDSPTDSQIVKYAKSLQVLMEAKKKHKR